MLLFPFLFLYPPQVALHGPKVSRRTPCPDAPPVSFGPPQPTNLRNNTFTHKTQWAHSINLDFVDFTDFLMS